MEVPCLNIRQEYAKLNIRTDRGGLDLKNASKPAEMDAVRQDGRLDIAKTKGGFAVDSYPCRYARGQKSVTDFSRDNAAAGMQAIKAFASRITQNSIQIQDGVGQKIIPNVAYTNARMSRPASRVTFTSVPSPDVSYEPDKLSFSYQPTKITVNFAATKIENNSRDGKPEISLAQRESIRMWVTMGKYDVYV